MIVSNSSSFTQFSSQYLTRLNQAFDDDVIENAYVLAKHLKEAWSQKRKVFICGNGGSAANAVHMANDFHFGVGCSSSSQSARKVGLRVEALPSNQGIITCLANDLGYEYIYSNQLDANAEPNDLLIVLSGSGNSPNIINALHAAKRLGMTSCAIVGFDGGLAKQMADIKIHSSINDMQVAEDVQLIVGHLCMQFLSKQCDSI